MLGPPLYLDVSTWNRHDLRLQWLRPQTRDDRTPRVDSYKIQWKETSGIWDAPEDVSEAVYQPPHKDLLSYVLTGLTGGIDYDVRVIATNDVGDSEPSKCGDR